MGADRDRFSTATRLRALGAQAAERVYRAQGRKVRTPRKGRLTGRAALLALVLCSLVVALAYPTRQYVTQRSEIADQRRQAEHARAEVKRLREQRARWRDPAYVERQARTHLHFVRPGETGYTMRDGTAEVRRPREHGPADRAWYQNMWDGVDSADQAGQAE
ncbi:FtsB family cell division protein [Streptomyces sp. 8N114]|uniref:FtsB family cell division protein n=1 Tax=Streptomyces sp. 8N114 TaxID=3457419 RepID=UPI003FD4701E